MHPPSFVSPHWILPFLKARVVWYLPAPSLTKKWPSPNPCCTAFCCTNCSARVLRAVMSAWDIRTARYWNGSSWITISSTDGWDLAVFTCFILFESILIDKTLRSTTSNDELDLIAFIARPLNAGRTVYGPEQKWMNENSHTCALTPHIAKSSLLLTSSDKTRYSTFQTRFVKWR